MTEHFADEIKQATIDRLAGELLADRTHALTACLSAMARFHGYRWSNVLLIHAQRPTATRVAGYHAWYELGRFVKPGEKGILIEAPRAVARAEHAALTDVRSPKVHPAYVFDVAQTAGKPLPTAASHRISLKPYHEKLREIALRNAPYVIAGDEERIASAKGHIQLPAGLTRAQEFSFLTHRLMHRRLHHQLPVAVLDAEAAAASGVVHQALGVKHEVSRTNLLALYRGDPRLLADSLATIHDGASEMLRDLQSPERISSAPARTPSASSSDSRAVSGQTNCSTPDPSHGGPDLSDSFEVDR